MYWENEISAQYSFAHFKPNQFLLALILCLLRLGSAYKSNAIKQDSYYLQVGILTKTNLIIS
jgi:hypothetical protein